MQQLHPYKGNDLCGWMYDDELEFLYNIANQMESIVEIGTFNGRSTHALISGSKVTKIYCVDPWQDQSEWLPKDTQSKAEYRYRGFLQMLKSMKAEDRVTVLRTTSVEASKLFEDKSIDMVFIDGLHELEAVQEDIECWLPKVNKLISGHDYEQMVCPDVKTVVDKKFNGKVKVCGTIWGVWL